MVFSVGCIEAILARERQDSNRDLAGAATDDFDGERLRTCGTQGEADKRRGQQQPAA